jgi:hypothetical protein
MSNVDQRYQEKLRARAEGRTPVVQQLPEPAAGDTPEAVEARFRAKIARHNKPEPKSDEGKGEKKPKDGKTDKADATGGEPKSDEGKGEKKPKDGKTDKADATGGEPKSDEGKGEKKPKA